MNPLGFLREAGQAGAVLSGFGNEDYDRP